MIISFYLRFSTVFGQNLFISGNSEALGDDVLDAALPLQYYNKEYWYASIDIDALHEPHLHYRYILKDKDDITIIEGEKNRIISITDKPITVIDTWNHAGDRNNVFFTQPFKETLLVKKNHNSRLKTPVGKYAEFRVKAPLLNPNEIICIIGDGILLGEWTTEKPILLSNDGEWFMVKLDLSLETFPIKYKYGVFNVKEKKFKYFETGEDRILSINLYNLNPITILHDGFIQHDYTWKGAGVAVPVFSLRSKDSFGTGEFNDLKLLVDWAKITGLKLIQLLPINDTTATHSAQDSYPYAAISAFALNPLYINLHKVAQNGGHELLKPYSKKQKLLNELPDLDYDQVMKYKITILLELYHHQKGKLNRNDDYKKFLENNKTWLKAYAAFCYLRDKNGTSDFTSWQSNTVYDEASIDKLLISKNAEQIKFHFFVQYHLHLQLKDSVKYAHENHIILKGDIPIGVFRNGCDTWMNPELFNMDQQSGAPPDDFAVKGQNWGFPTYNWQQMQKDGFQWWKARFQQMNRYFDAFRIDHILGFFRIWSIPLSAIEGILGKFQPAIPVYKEEFEKRHINLDIERFCEPYITEQLISKLFNTKSDFVKSQFLERKGNGTFNFKNQFNTQRKLEIYFSKISDIEIINLKNGLFDLITNVILFKDPTEPLLQFHFRIAMDQTSSFSELDEYTKSQLKDLYVNYFYNRQNELWRREAMNKLPSMKAGTDMLICGEDLGMVPACVPEVMRQLGILSLEIQRMPKDPNVEFFHPKDAPYMSVVTPSTHDMSTIRGWWEEDRQKTQRFYHYMLGHYGEAPLFCESWLNREIVIQHLYSPAMWAVFQIQDLLGMDEKIRRNDPNEERINVPANSNHYWRYRMHLILETLIKQKEFNEHLKDAIKKSGRS